MLGLDLGVGVGIRSGFESRVPVWVSGSGFGHKSRVSDRVSGFECRV